MAGTAVVVSLAGGVVAARVNWTDLEVIGIDDGQQLQRKDLSELRLRIVAGGPAAGAVRVTLNGTDVPVTEAQRGEALITSRKPLVGAIRPGKNTYVVTLGGRYMLGGERIERTFDFDPSGPTLMLPRAVVDPGNGEVISMRGIANDTASLRANGQAIPLGEGGGSNSTSPRARARSYSSPRTRTATRHARCCLLRRRTRSRRTRIPQLCTSLQPAGPIRRCGPA
ncbi:MAG: hypothetical protein WKF58_00405 [Ilumatobacteraceae bacterium]